MSQNFLKICFRYIINLGTKSGNHTSGSLIGENPVFVNITVKDANDNYPHFNEDFRKVSIKEDAPFGYTAVVLHAEDDDLIGSEAAIITYEIISGNDAELFSINKSSGAVLVNASLDCDLKPALHNLVVQACDRDSMKPLCSLSQLQIQIEDVNDNPPKFPVMEYFEFVGENESVGTSIFTVHAFDLDRGIFGRVNYSIVVTSSEGFADIDDSWKFFSVDNQTGSVSTATIFDYEKRSRYAITISASDIGGHRAAVIVRIEIDSRDEFYPQFTERIYRFTVRVGRLVAEGTVIGYITATDEDGGPDGRVVYQLTAQHPFLKLNRTTGALTVKQKLMSAKINFKDRVKLLVSASSGRQNSLSNVTAVEVSWVDDYDLSIHRGSTIHSGPTDFGTNMVVAANDSLADWILGLLITLFLLLGAFGSGCFYLHMRNLRHKKPGAKPAPGGESNATASNSYVDPTTFDSIAIRGVAGVMTNSAPCSGLVNISGINNNIVGANVGLTCQFAPPKYDEIPVYGTSAQGRTRAASELSRSDHSGSSGRGSAEDDGEDEEIRMINESQQTGESMSDLSVHNTQEYLARLGIVDPPVSNPRSRPPEALPLESLHLFEDEVVNEADVATLIYGKIGDLRRPNSRVEVQGVPSMNGSLSSIVHSEEELTGSYNWDYLLDWGPQYQPLAHVFSEIASLKDDAASVQSGNSNSSGRPKSLRRAFVPPPPPPPLITNIAPRSLTAASTGLTRGVLPRSPISHDASTFPSAALSPSFSPSLSPLATRSPSISPLVPDAPTRMNQCPPRSVSFDDVDLRI